MPPLTLAHRHVARAPGRFVLSAGGVAFGVVLVLFLSAVYHGFVVQASVFIQEGGADVWVSEAGQHNAFYSVSRIPGESVQDVARVPGVATVSAYVARPALVTSGGDQFDVFLVGFTGSDPAGGPWDVVAGRADVRSGEIVIDRVLAHGAGKDLGDTVLVNGHPFRVVGIMDSANAFIYTYAFVTMSDARAVAREEHAVSYLLLEVAPGADPVQVAQAVNAEVPGVTAFGADAFAEMNREKVSRAFLPILVAIGVMGGLVGVSVITLTTWGAITERRVEFGVLKALGAGNGLLYRDVLVQAGLASVAGSAAGIGAYHALAAVLTRALPQLALALPTRVVATVLAVTLLIAGLAALHPARVAARLDPALAFREARSP